MVSRSGVCDAWDFDIADMVILVAEDDLLDSTSTLTHKK